MSKKKDTAFFEEALADAKAVKKTALELAKQTLEEHFAPKLNSMIDKKLKESLDEEYSEDDDDSEIDEKKEEVPSSEEKKSEEMDEDSINLEELLKELESEEDGSEEEKSEMDEAYASEEEDGKKGVKPMDEKKSEESEDNDKEDLDEKAEYLRLKEKFEGKKKSSEEEKPSEEGEEEKDFDVDEEFDVEALLRELEDGDSSEEEHKSEVDESYASELEDKKKGTKPMDEKKEKSELEKVKSELQEVKSMLKDVNLANSKLLYFNKIVKENENLSKGDKANILKQLDKCTDAKQAKLVYETVVSALKSKTKSNNKKAINESFASKAAGTSTAKTENVEDNQMRKRFQELAFGKFYN